jgi:hypothetical protein
VTLAEVLACQEDVVFDTFKDTMSSRKRRMASEYLNKGKLHPVFDRGYQAGDDLLHWVAPSGLAILGDRHVQNVA